MTATPDEIEFAERLVAAFPLLVPELEEHIRDYDELLLHLFVADVERWAEVQAIEDPDQAKELIDHLVAEYDRGDPYVTNALAVSFLEHIQTDSPLAPVARPLVLVVAADSPGFDPPRPGRHRWIIAAVMVATALVIATVVIVRVGSSGPQPVVATFQVAGDETYKIELATPELIEHARQLLDGQDVAAIPLGTVVRDDAGPNEPWSWHIDPATLEFADITIEVCDGLPSYVEDGTVTSEQYCPWSAQVIAIDGLPD